MPLSVYSPPSVVIVKMEALTGTCVPITSASAGRLRTHCLGLSCLAQHPNGAQGEWLQPSTPIPKLPCLHLAGSSAPDTPPHSRQTT